jgi:hypothetical protein
MPRLDQVPRHRGAHLAEADKSDVHGLVSALLVVEL